MAAKTQKKPAQKKPASNKNVPKKSAQKKTAQRKTTQKTSAQKKAAPKKKMPAVLLALAAVLLIAQLIFRLPIPDELAPILEQVSGGKITESQFAEAKEEADKLKDSIAQFFPEASQSGLDGQDGQGSSASEGDGDEPVLTESLPEDILSSSIPVASLEDLPEYSGAPVVMIDDNIPYFTPEDLVGTSFESYSALDGLGRCGVAYANIGADLMPMDEREAISSVKPAGWHSVKYDCVEGKYLYNRCHLIGYQLTGENANKKNLITGTRYLNVTGMLPYENMVADYIRETGNHVLYRVTPVYEGDDLLARGLLMEAKSVEDDGAGICFNIFAYNVQPGVEIDYATGNSWLAE